MEPPPELFVWKDENGNTLPPDLEPTARFNEVWTFTQVDPQNPGTVLIGIYVNAPLAQFKAPTIVADPYPAAVMYLNIGKVPQMVLNHGYTQQYARGINYQLKYTLSKGVDSTQLRIGRMGNDGANEMKFVISEVKESTVIEIKTKVKCLFILF